MNYHNVYHSKKDETFFVLICTRAGRYTDTGYATIEEAAWQADRAKWVLSNHGLIGRLSAYNFPERINAETESSWSVLPPPLVEFYCKHLTTDTPVTEDEAARAEEAKMLALANAEKQKLLDEESKKLSDEKNKVIRAKLQNLTERVRDVLNEFDELNLPKSTKERNALAAALSAIHIRWSRLS